MLNIFAVTIGSILGGLSRYFLGGFVQRLSGNSFPYGTLAVNLAGCFVVGFLATFLGERVSLGHSGRLLLITGFCGAFPTFSAFMVETDFLVRSGHAWAAFLNVALSLAAGFALFHLGSLLGKLQ